MLVLIINDEFDLFVIYKSFHPDVKKGKLFKIDSLLVDNFKHN